MTTPVLFIDNNQQLADYCRKLAGRDVIALDTEFYRVKTFYAEAGLFQINDGDTIALVDPLVIDDWRPLLDVLHSHKTVKVLHACDEDIELFYHFLQARPVAVFDTQIAAALCGYDFSLSYQRLVQQLLGIEVAKGHSRSDWMQRPLSEEQLRYAADDVRYLLPVYSLLQQQIQQEDKLAILEDEYQATLANIASDDYSDAWQRIKDGWKLNALQFARLKKLATWREQMMREKNLPRNRLARNEALLALAMQSNWNKHQLFAVDGLPAATIKHHGEELLAMLEDINCGSGYTEQMPKPARPDPLLGRIRHELAAEAKKIRIAPELLSKKLFVQALYQYLQISDSEQSDTLPEQISGWRRDFYQRVASTIQNGSSLA